jgi:Lon-like ATP-dependent protease
MRSFHFNKQAFRSNIFLFFSLQNIKEGLEGHPVEWYGDVFNLVFPDIDRDVANTCKICEWQEKNKKDESSQSDDRDD